MLDNYPYNAYPLILAGYGEGKCKRCGQGPVTESEGLLMCMNCGDWRATKHMHVDFSQFRKAILNTLSKMKDLLTSKPSSKKPKAPEILEEVSI